MKEGDLQKQIIDYLLLKGVVLLRINSVSRGFTRAVTRCGRGKESGVSDLIGCTKEGRFIAVEVKLPGGRVSDEQKTFLDQVKTSGGIAILAYSVEDVVNSLELDKRVLSL